MSYACFVPGGDHLGIACIFHDWKKIKKKVSPPISPFLGGQKVEPFFSPYLDPLPVYEFL
jgi:hypothetical protein